MRPQSDHPAAGLLTLFVSSRIGLDLDAERTLVASTIDNLSSDFARAWLWERDGLGGRSLRDA